MAQKPIGIYCEWCSLDDLHCKCRRGACHESRYPNDDKLRAAGYVIHARPRSGPVLWRRRDKVVTQAQALQALERD